MLTASATLAAIGQAFGGKSSKAMSAFRQSLGGDGDAASAGDSANMSKLRRRIQGLVAKEG